MGIGMDPDWDYVASIFLRRLFLAGRTECLDYLLAKLDSRHLLKADRHGRRELEGDQLAGLVGVWRPRRRVYHRDATPPPPERWRQEIKAWLRKSFLLIRSGKKPEMNSEPLFLMPDEYCDPWEKPVMGLGWE